MPFFCLAHRRGLTAELAKDLFERARQLALEASLKIPVPLGVSQDGRADFPWREAARGTSSLCMSSNGHRRLSAGRHPTFLELLRDFFFNFFLNVLV